MTMFTDMTIDDLKHGADAELSAQLGLIRASGADARSFLHAQLTQDILNLEGNDTKLAGYCSAKGRLFAVLQVYAVGEDVFLVTHRPLIELLVKRLKMFVLRAKVAIEDVSDGHRIKGKAGEACLAHGVAETSDHTQRLGLLPALINGESLARELLIIRVDTRVESDRAVSTVGIARDLGVEGWQWLAIVAGEGHVEAATLEAFVPQMINLDRIGGVNFKKGCYPGQEVVARSHYLGKLKRRMQWVQLHFDNAESAREAATNMPAKTDVCSSLDASQPIGVVVSAAVSLLNHSTVDALVEVSLPMLDGGALLSINGHEAALQPLPYALSD
ncbi:tRNA-modifying protein YgfZ [Ephemeroptericola cinctiostellae]|uniref:tRNA-modifying protein YgfZ n=1 Tax=Ephemeroptericola cinctiostellae TaxID=2268024 RepID=A0A345DCR0_9BURK|nr:folate-binding protein YgfZ [Ephemeroptericola cinctiostellae]AXF86148.1 tRNA-modifying protein YgfZ [Ephemeroptericola cinctiostellae]